MKIEITITQNQRISLRLIAQLAIPKASDLDENHAGRKKSCYPLESLDLMSVAN